MPPKQARGKPNDDWPDDFSDETYESSQEDEKLVAKVVEPQVKLSLKEKRRLKKQHEYDKQTDLINKKGGVGHSKLGDNFSISQAQQSDKKNTQLENAVD